MESEIRDTRRQDRREFVNAVAEHLWVRPGTDRPMLRPHFVLLFTALAAAGAVAAGVVLHLLHRNDPPAPRAAAAPTAVAPRVWTAVAGWDCAGDATRGFSAVGRNRAWYTVDSGGWDKDGCNGSFAAVPMSGSAKDDQDQYAVWTFAPGQPYTSCQVSAYSPRVTRLTDAAGTSVHYALQSDGASIADVVVDQPAAAGRWVAVGSYPVGERGLSVRLANRGRPPVPGGRIAVAQFRAVCTSS